MIQQFLSEQFTKGLHRRLFIQVLKCCLGASLVVYATVRLVFHDFPFEWKEDIILLVKMLIISSAFAAGISLLILLTDAIDYAFKNGWTLYRLISIKKLAIAALVLLVTLSACNAQTTAVGMVKDVSTGLSASYKNMKPGKVLLVMNNEELHHTDIPFGESFLLVNKGINGLMVKEGQVSVGCSLSVTDKAGKFLLKTDDLFKGRDVFEKDSVNYLKCTVSTGKPMEWEEKYNVKVVFWDKYGSGRIENKVTIRCIDLP